MTQPQSDQSLPTSGMYSRALANMQNELVQARVQEAVYRAEIERLTQVCSQQAMELMRLRAG